MSDELTVSNVHRQNILNNQLALAVISDKLDITGIFFKEERHFTKRMVADFYEIDERTIERYIEKNSEELKSNGYILIKGKVLKEFKLQYVSDIDVGNKTPQLGLFNFKAFLNIGMILTNSKKAQQLRSTMLDIVISSINEKVGGGTKYINRRDANYLRAALTEENYRKNLTDAVSSYVDGHQSYKHAHITNRIYQAVFKENAAEYRKVLRLNKTDNPRHTMYAEVLLVISSFEAGVAYEINQSYQRQQQNLSVQEVFSIIDSLADHPLQAPYIHDVRTKMASRDLGFRDALHANIADYLKAVPIEDFERFIGNQSVDFEQILEENKDTLKRLKQDGDE